MDRGKWWSLIFVKIAMMLMLSLMMKNMMMLLS